MTIIDVIKVAKSHKEAAKEIVRLHRKIYDQFPLEDTEATSSFCKALQKSGLDLEDHSNLLQFPLTTSFNMVSKVVTENKLKVGFDLQD